MKILLVEDDLDLGNLLVQYLKMHHFDVRHAADGKTALDVFRSESFAAAVVDVMLPDTNGFELVKIFKKHVPGISFLFLTAKNRKEDIIEGLKLGADDYVTKPFEPEELVLRLNIIVRRNNAIDVEKLKIGDCVLYTDEFRLITPVREYKLTQKETELLAYLIKNNNRVINRETLLKTLWGENDYFLGRSMDVFMSRLRKFLNDDPSLQLETLRGKGYSLRVK